MRKTFEREIKDIDGQAHLYRVEQFGGEAGTTLAIEVSEIASEAFKSVPAEVFQAVQRAFQAGAGGDKVAVEIPLDGNTIGSGLASVATAIQKRGGVAFMKRLLEFTIRDGHKFQPGRVGEFCFDQTFAGNYLELLRLLSFVLEVNFSSFFGTLPAGSKDS